MSYRLAEKKELIQNDILCEKHLFYELKDSITVVTVKQVFNFRVQEICFPESTMLILSVVGINCNCETDTDSKLLIISYRFHLI